MYHLCLKIVVCGNIIKNERSPPQADARTHTYTYYVCSALQQYGACKTIPFHDNMCVY